MTQKFGKEPGDSLRGNQFHGENHTNSRFLPIAPRKRCLKIVPATGPFLWLPLKLTPLIPFVSRGPFLWFALSGFPFIPPRKKNLVKRLWCPFQPPFLFVSFCLPFRKDRLPSRSPAFLFTFPLVAPFWLVSFCFFSPNATCGQALQLAERAEVEPPRQRARALHACAFAGNDFKGPSWCDRQGMRMDLFSPFHWFPLRESPGSFPNP